MKISGLVASAEEILAVRAGKSSCTRTRVFRCAASCGQVLELFPVKAEAACLCDSISGGAQDALFDSAMGREYSVSPLSI